MKTQRKLTVVPPPASLAMLLSTAIPNQFPYLKSVKAPPKSARSIQADQPTELESFRSGLPRHYEPAPPVSLPHLATAEAPALRVQPQNRPEYQVLVVDDDPSVRKAMHLLLEYDGHHVQAVDSGEKALALFARSRFDLVITDYSMWGMKGDQLATQIKQLCPDQPIIMATASAHEFKPDGKLAMGVDFILNKPFSRADLRQAMALVLV